MFRKFRQKDRLCRAAQVFFHHRAAALSFALLLSGSLPTGAAFGDITQTSGGQIRIVANLQTGTAYTVTPSDCGKLLSLSNSGNVTVAIPPAGATGLSNGCWIDIQNAGPASAVFTTGGSLVDGASGGFTLVANQGLRLVSNGSGYLTQRGQ